MYDKRYISRPSPIINSTCQTYAKEEQRNALPSGYYTSIYIYIYLSVKYIIRLYYYLFIWDNSILINTNSRLLGSVNRFRVGGILLCIIKYIYKMLLCLVNYKWNFDICFYCINFDN